MALSATANGRSLVSQTWHLLNISRNGNAMAINSFSGPAAPGKPCRKQSNGAGNRILNLMPSMTTFRKSSNSMDTTAGRFPVITIRNGAMPLCLFCNIQFYFCYLGKFFFSVQQFIFLLFRQAVENFLVTKKRDGQYTLMY